MDLIDLRSDTVTRPTPGMREAMAKAEVGDDVFGDDPTVLKLQSRVAELLGKEAGLFVPSGTMANQIALGTLCRPGDEVIADPDCHTVSFEGGALAALWGIQVRAVRAAGGLLDPADVEAAIRLNADRFEGVESPLADAVRRMCDHYPRTRALVLENTHNRGGGAVVPLERMRELAAVARRRGLSVHLDGARLFNAEAATGVDVREFAAGATLATICLSKGLGAPAGSVLCGPKDLLSQARRLRKRLGGAMRQAGVLAAAGLYALEHHRTRLAEDHANAARFARGLEGLGARLAKPVQTNMVFAAFPGRSAQDLCVALAGRGLLAHPEGSAPDTVRFVFHLDVPERAVDEALSRLGAVLKSHGAVAA